MCHIDASIIIVMRAVRQQQRAVGVEDETATDVDT